MTTAERIIREGPIATTDVAKLARKSTATVVRWITIGVPAGGARVFLDAMKVGHTYQTSHAAYVRFVDAQQPAKPILMPSRETRTRKPRTKAGTSGTLDRLGVA